MVLTTAYFPPISWFALVAKDFTLSNGQVKSSCIYLEACENYQKQTYRNRCKIYTSQGIETLNVPIIHMGGTINIPIMQVQIDYSTGWVNKTKRAIVSAYMTSAYFEYYKDELFAILDSHPTTLWELNYRLIKFFINKIGIKVDIYLTTNFLLNQNEDFRWKIHPKKEDNILKDLNIAKPYFQVFENKFGFIPNLSIMDLLFNEGPNSILFLKQY